MNWNHQLQYNVNLEVSLEKTLLTLTASRDGLKNLWKPEEQRDIEYRLDILRATNGAHVEVYQ